MRTANFILLVGVAVILLRCGLFDGGQESAGSDDEAPLVVSGTPPGMEAPITYDGPSSLEERIFASPVIARVRLDSATSAVESATTYHGMKYVVLLEFDFLVLEYLKGSGATDIVAVWAAAPFFDTRQEAEDALPAIAAARDTQWDDREAIVFLQEDSRGFLASTQQASRYYLAWGGSWPRYSGDDGYSIASRHNKLWLPAEAAVGAPSQLSGNQQRFLMDVPPATGTAPTITLGEVKTRIAAVTAKLNAGDGSEEYTECVQRTYWYEGINRYRIERGDEGVFYRIPDQRVGLRPSHFKCSVRTARLGRCSGQPRRTLVRRRGWGLVQCRVWRIGSLRLFGRWHERLHSICSARGVGAPAPHGGI